MICMRCDCRLIACYESGVGERCFVSSVIHPGQSNFTCADCTRKNMFNAVDVLYSSVVYLLHVGWVQLFFESPSSKVVS